jgi:hypothetical protein
VTKGNHRSALADGVFPELLPDDASDLGTLARGADAGTSCPSGKSDPSDSAARADDSDSSGGLRRAAFSGRS